MTKYDYEDVVKQLASLDKSKLLLAATTCAYKVAPIIKFLALPSTRAVCQDIIDLGWRMESEAIDSTSTWCNLRSKLLESPEFLIEYPDSLIHAVCRPLDIVRNVTDVVLGQSEVDRHDAVDFSLMLSICDNLDSTNVDVLSTEQRSQLAVMFVLKSKEADAATQLAKLRSEAEVVSDAIASALPFYCFEFMSSCCMRSWLTKPK